MSRGGWRGWLRMIVVLLAVGDGMVACGGTQNTTLTAPGARVIYAGISAVYANALLRIAAAARDIYATKYRCDMPAEVIVNVTRNPYARTSFWNDGESQMFLTVTSMHDLAPPAESGYF